MSYEDGDPITEDHCERYDHTWILDSAKEIYVCDVCGLEDDDPFEDDDDDDDYQEEIDYE